VAWFVDLLYQPGI